MLLLQYMILDLILHRNHRQISAHWVIFFFFNKTEQCTQNRLFLGRISTKRVCQRVQQRLSLQHHKTILEWKQIQYKIVW